MFMVCFDRGVLISTDQEKIALILVNGNYVWPKGDWNSVDFMQNFCFLKQFLFHIMSLLTKYEECLT